MTPGEVAWALIGVVSLACWLVSLRLHPYARCWKCKGTGRNPGSTSKRYGPCGRCGMTGRRLRVGAALVHKRRK